MNNTQAPKQVIVMRKDLNMRKGKMVAQGAHASIAVILNMMSFGIDETPSHGSVVARWQLRTNIDSPIYQWIMQKFTKICVSVDSEAELIEIYTKAKDLGFPCALITDSGLTEFNGVPTTTCCAIGPWHAEEIDKITGHLKLL
jgi:PTH2 family peptidyl-tRNA hydrolase